MTNNHLKIIHPAFFVCNNTSSSCPGFALARDSKPTIRDWPIRLCPASRPALAFLDLIGVVMPFGGVGHIGSGPSEKFLFAGAQNFNGFFRRPLVTVQARDRHDFRRALHIKRIDAGLVDGRADRHDAVALDHHRRRAPQSFGQRHAFGLIQDIDRSRKDRRAAFETGGLHVYPIDGLICQTEGDAHGSMAMHDCIHIRTQFKNRGIDHSLAGNRTDAREFVEGIVEAYEPIFVSLFRRDGTFAPQCRCLPAAAHRRGPKCLRSPTLGSWRRF